MVSEILTVVTGIWNTIPPSLREWSKSEVLNFLKKHAPDFFEFCRNKINLLWSKVPNSKVKDVVDKATSVLLELNDKIPQNEKKRFFEEVTGSRYNPDAGVDMEWLAEEIQTDEEKKAATMQMAYLISVLGEINQKQEIMLENYMASIKITEELKQEIIDEMKEAEREFAKFAKELRRLDQEFQNISVKTGKARKAANDIIDLI